MAGSPAASLCDLLNDRAITADVAFIEERLRYVVTFVHRVCVTEARHVISWDGHGCHKL